MNRKARVKWALVVSSALLACLAVQMHRPAIARAVVHAGDALLDQAAVYAPETADLLYRASLLIDPAVKGAWHQRARVAFLRGDFDVALTYIERQIALHGTSVMPSFYIRALIHGYRKEYEEAARDFLTYLEWDPDGWAARNDLAWAYFAAGEFDLARAASERGLLSNPQNPWLLTMRGMSRFNLGDAEGAAADLAYAAELAENLTAGDWSKAYPGNDPRIAGTGLAAMREAIAENLALVHSRLGEGGRGL